MSMPWYEKYIGVPMLMLHDKIYKGTEGRIGHRIARAARQSGLHADGNNVVINDGKAAFQSVFHIHLHVLPRHDGDKMSFAKGMLVRRDPDREESGRLLREALAQLDSTPQD